MESKEKWYESIFWFCYKWWHRLFWNKITDLQWQIPNVFKRAKRGWGNADTWHLNYYLSKVIAESVTHLKKHAHCYPTNLTPRKWNNILNKIIWSFEIAQEISDSNIIYIHSNVWNLEEYNKMKEMVQDLNQQSPEYPMRVLTKSQSQKFEEGFKLFQEYFFSLWD